MSVHTALYVSPTLTFCVCVCVCGKDVSSATEPRGAVATCGARTNVAIQTRRFSVVRRARRTSTAATS